MKPIISVKEARKILGKKYEKMTDKQVEEIINDLDFMAKMALDEARKRPRMK